MEEDKVRKDVREGYAQIAREGLCCSPATSCCSSTSTYDEMSKRMGYNEEELKAVPEGANLSLGCGNPIALASLKEGETVVDLGAGAGLDCFLASGKAGKEGKVIGVDMTPEMIDRARENAKKGGYGNVEFRLGEIENLPVADNTADLVISNCVVNLAPNKQRVFEEAFRILKPGGRLMVSDIVLLKELPEATRKRAHAASCVKGAIKKEEYVEAIEKAGFQEVEVVKETRYSYEEACNDPNSRVILKNRNQETQELKAVRELDDDAKMEVKRILDSAISVSVKGTKPSEK